MNKGLNKKLWDRNELKREVQNKLLEISQHFFQFLNIQAPIIDIIFTGSLANYNWHSESDIDLHIIIDPSKVGCSTLALAKELLKAKKDIYNSKRNILIKGFQVELYAQDVNETHSSSGQYSLIQKKWLKKPEKYREPVDKGKILKLSKIYKELIDDVVQLEDEKLKLNLANTIKKDIVQKRKNGLEKEGEQSTYNLLFKKLRKDEFYNLFNAISKATDNELSLE